MKLLKFRDGKRYYPALAFAIPFTAMIILMIAVGATPFGHKSLLYSDMWHQYFPFFKAYRQALLSGESLLHSWNIGMGADYLGLISYYLASPLYLLSVLIPESWVLPYFSLLMPVKLGLASLFFSIFLQKIFHKDDFSIAIFGAFYGLCAWALGYQWNIMWLDTFALLPLVALGTVYLLRDKKFILYTVTLALSIFINYYIGFFTCIFVLLLFICYQICRCKSWERFFQDLGRIALFSALAIGLTAILSLPAYAALQDTYSRVNSFPEGLSLNIVAYEDYAVAREAWDAYKLAKEAGSPSLLLWFEAMGKSFVPVFIGMGQAAGNLAGGAVPTFMEGLPNVYTGVSVLMLSFLFLMAGNVKMRDKLCCLFLLLFFMASFVIRQLDYIWHGFHFTNQIPYRFSFLFSFVMLYMAYRAYLVRHRFKWYHVALAFVLTLEVFLLSKYAAKVPDALGSLGELFDCIGRLIATVGAEDKSTFDAARISLQSLYSTHGNTYVFLVYNGVFLLAVFGLLLYQSIVRPVIKQPTMEQKRELAILRTNRRNLVTGLLAVVMVTELVMNVVNFGVNFGYTDITDYPHGTEYTESMIKYMKEREDSLFYRAEVTHTQTLNDGALNGYNGISTFTSSANVKVTNFMTALGYAAQNNWNRYCFEESSPVANLFLNLKYMLERDGQVEENPYFDDIHHYGNVHLLENNAYLPLGFLVESGTENADIRYSSGNTFSNQNALFSAATGLDEDVWKVTPEDWLTFEGRDVSLTAQHKMGYCAYSTTSGGTLIYRYTIQEEGFLCLDINMYARNYFYLYLNGNYLFSDSITLPQSLSVCQVRPGDVVEVRASCKANENSSMTIRAALLDDEIFRMGYEILNASTWELTDFSTTRVAGTIDCNRDGLMYTSIPDDGNWKATVDGQEVEPVLVGESMLALNLTEGAHEIVFTYENQAFNYGATITVICLLAFLALIYLQNRVYWNNLAKKAYHFIRRK